MYLTGSAFLLVDAFFQFHLQRYFLTVLVSDERSAVLADFIAAVFYVIASAFGGYATRPMVIRVGTCCWVVGSLISTVRPCRFLCIRTRALEARGQSLPAPGCVHPSGEVELQVSAV